MLAVILATIRCQQAEIELLRSEVATLKSKLVSGSSSVGFHSVANYGEYDVDWPWNDD